MFKRLKRYFSIPKEERNLEKYTRKKYVPSLTKEEIESLSKYTVYDYRRLNDFLRKDNFKEANKTMIKNLDVALDKFKFNDSVHVYRKIDFKSLEEIREFEEKIKLHNGYIDKAYTSTSLTINTRFDYRILLDIEICKNTYAGAYIRPIAFLSSEKEYLIKRNIFMELLHIDYFHEDGLFKEKIYLKIK